MRERRLAILAGGGALPREIADSAARQGCPVTIVAIDGEADADFAAHSVTRVNWGQIGAMVRALKSSGATDLVIVGHVHRPDLWALKPDLGFIRYFPQILKIVASGGDDGVLRRVVRFFNQQGLNVLGPGDAAPELVAGAGPIARAAPSTADAADIRVGLELIRTLGAYDIGQSVIVCDGRIEAIEGAEGTDRMIKRAGHARKMASGTQGRGVLVKRSKPGQDLRVDMPAIGPATVESVREAGLSGIAVEAGQVLVAERAETLKGADAAGLFIDGVTDVATPLAALRFDPLGIKLQVRVLGRLAPESHAMLDATKGIAALDALASFSAGRAVVVVRNHVLAVEAGEGVEALVARAAGLRQWKSVTRARRGVATLAHATDVTCAVVEAVAAAGCAGIAIAEPASTSTDVSAQNGPADGAVAEAERQGVFVIRRAAREGSPS